MNRSSQKTLLLKSLFVSSSQCYWSRKPIAAGFCGRETNVSIMRQTNIKMSLLFGFALCKTWYGCFFAAMFLPHRVHLTGFIRVFTTSLTSQQGETLPQTAEERNVKRNIQPLPPWISPGKGFLWFSPRFLFLYPRLCVCDPSDTCVMPNASRGSVCFYLPFFSITFCHFHNDSLYWRRFPTSVNTWHHNFPWAFHKKTKERSYFGWYDTSFKAN